MNRRENTVFTEESLQLRNEFDGHGVQSGVVVGKVAVVVVDVGFQVKRILFGLFGRLSREPAIDFDLLEDIDGPFSGIDFDRRIDFVERLKGAEVRAIQSDFGGKLTFSWSLGSLSSKIPWKMLPDGSAMMTVGGFEWRTSREQASTPKLSCVWGCIVRGPWIRGLADERNGY